MEKKSVAAALLLLVILVGLINNAKNIRTQLSYISGQSIVAPKSANNVPSSRATSSNHNFVAAECLKARKHIVPVSSYHKLPKPYINLGFPKMGTSSLHAYFICGGLTSTHLRCGKTKKCSVCIRESVEAGLPPLSQCGKADMYAQIDDGVYFPQIENLVEFVHGYPNATFFLTFRSMEKWYHSISHWPPRKNGPHMDKRFKKFNITGSPSNEGRSNPEEFNDWYCKHVQRVRNIVSLNPSHTLVEVDIEDPDIGQRMEDIFGIDKSCWGHTNVNPNIHPEVNQSEVVLSRASRRGKNEEDDVESLPESTNEDGMNYDDGDEQSNGAAENESTNSLDYDAAKEENREEEDYHYESYDAEDESRSESFQSFRDKGETSYSDILAKPQTSTTGRPTKVQQCSPEQLAIIKTQLPPDDCERYADRPQTQRCSFSYATRCPDSSAWIDNHYKQLSNSQENNNTQRSFVGIFVGCNKGMDAINNLRMGSGNSLFDKKHWRDAMSEDVSMADGVCHQDNSPQFELPQDTTEKLLSSPSQVFCIEPMPSTYRALSQSAARLGYDTNGFTVTHAAVSKDDGMIPFPNSRKAGKETKSIDCSNPKEDCIDVPMYSLDTYVSKFLSKRIPINYLSVDVEGFDQDVLLGAKTTLRRVHYLEFEYNWMGSWRNQTLSHLIDLLDNEFGFTCYWPGINNSIWRITGCWLDHYNIHFWSNVACVNRNMGGAKDIAERMEALFRETLKRGDEFVMSWENRKKMRLWRRGKDAKRRQ